MTTENYRGSSEHCIALRRGASQPAYCGAFSDPRGSCGSGKCTPHCSTENSHTGSVTPVRVAPVMPSSTLELLRTRKPEAGQTVTDGSGA